MFKFFISKFSNITYSNYLITNIIIIILEGANYINIAQFNQSKYFIGTEKKLMKFNLQSFIINYKQEIKAKLK